MTRRSPGPAPSGLGRPGQVVVPAGHQQAHPLGPVQPAGVDHGRGALLLRPVVRRDEVVPDKRPLGGQAHRPEQVALGGRDEDVGRHQGPPGPAVHRGGQGHRHRGHPGPPVAAVLDAPDRQVPGTVMAHRAVPEELPVGAGQLVVVDGGHQRDPGVPAGVQHRRAQQRERVVQVHDVRALGGQDGGQVAVRFPAPHRLGRQGGLLGLGPALDVVAEALEPDDLVPPGRERVALAVDDPVLAAGRDRTVAVVGQQDLHPGPSPISDGSRCGRPSSGGSTGPARLAATGTISSEAASAMSSR